MKIRPTTAGFTLIEVLMAIVLGGLILTSAAGFLFGVFNMTIAAQEEPLFEEHVDSTARFLEYVFGSALPSEDADTGRRNSQRNGQNNNTANGEAGESGSSNGQSGSISWQRIPGESGLNPEALSFRLAGDLPILVDEKQAYLPEVECWLIFKDDEGLLLRWRTQAMQREDADDLLTSVISPYVTSLIYWYYDHEDDSWEDSDEVETADEGGNRMPQFIALTYEYPDGQEAKRHILLPATDADRPLP